MFRGIGYVGFFISMTAAGAGEVPVVAPKPAEILTTPFCEACRPRATPRPGGPILPVQDGPAFVPPIAPPGPLPLPEETAPLPSAEAGPALSKLFEDLLPNAKAAEQRIWEEELRGLPPELARDILKSRQHDHEPEPLPEAGLLPPQVEPEPIVTAEPVRIAQGSPAASAGDGTLAALRRAEAIRLHNIANAETVGFKRLRPVTREAVGAGGVAEVSAERIDAQGELEATGRAFDLAIDGAGLFQVRRGEAVAVTRRGTFRLVDGEIVLVVGSEAWSLHPPLRVPAEATEVVVAANGEVACRLADEPEPVLIGRIELARVVDPSRLESLGGGLLTVTDGAGPVTVGVPSGAGLGSVRQGCLERSNVDLDAELKSLERLRRQIAALQPASLPQLARPEVPARSAQSPGRPNF